MLSHTLVEKTSSRYQRVLRGSLRAQLNAEEGNNTNKWKKIKREKDKKQMRKKQKGSKKEERFEEEKEGKQQKTDEKTRGKKETKRNKQIH